MRDFNIKATVDESLMLSGLGKKTICIGFPYMIDFYDLSLSTPIVLTADGGQVRTTEDKKRVRQYASYDKNELLNLYKTKYPYDYVKEENFNLLEHKLVSLENNERLVHYYEEAFGFKRLSLHIGGALMQTLLSTFMHHCDIND